MKRIISFLITCFVFGIISTAQNLEWAFNVGGVENDFSESVATDINGNVYLVGQFMDTVDLDPGPATLNFISNNVNNPDVFLQELDANGNLIWVKTFGNIGADYGRRVTTDKYGNVYFTGEFEDTVDFDPGTNVFNLVGEDGRDIFVVKLDSNGTFVWAKEAVEGSGTVYVHGINVDRLGNVLLGGIYTSTKDFNPGSAMYNLTCNGSVDVFIQKLDPNGNFVWAKSVGGGVWDYIGSLETDTLGNVYIAGSFNDTVDFDPGPAVYNEISNNSLDIFTLKLSNNGDFIWVKTMGGPEGDYATALTLDRNGNSYSVGYFKDTVDFDPGVGVSNLTSNGNLEIYISKLDENGNFVWAKSFGGEGIDLGGSVAIHDNKDLYITGQFQDTVIFNTGTDTLISTGSQTSYILNLKKNGDFKWVETIGNTSYSTSNSIITDLTGNIYIAGRFQDTAYLNFIHAPLVSNGIYDGFLVKLNQNYGLEFSNSSVLKRINAYPNPNNGNFKLDLGEIHPRTNIQIADLSGRVIYQSMVYNQQIIVINFEAPKGVYCLSIGNEFNQSAIKLIKQ